VAGRRASAVDWHRTSILRPHQQSSPTEEEKKEAHFKKKLEACGQYDEPSTREVKLLASKAKRDHDRGAAMRRPRWERMKFHLSR